MWYIPTGMPLGVRLMWYIPTGVPLGVERVYNSVYLLLPW